MSKLVNLQHIRGVAATLVVVSHGVAGTNQYGFSPGLITNHFDTWGDCGVDLFFALSGFLMVLTQHDQPGNPLSFLRKRFIRIVPLYYLLTLALALALLVAPSLFAMKSFDLAHLGFSLGFSWMFLTGTPPIVVPGWTLEYEMLFYVVFAAIILIPRTPLRVLAVCLTMPLFLLFDNVQPVIIEFCFGAIAALVYLRGGIASLLGSGLVVVGALCLVSAGMVEKFDSFERPIYWGIPAAVIVLGAALAPTLKWRVLGIIGDSSYSIYLTHLVVLPVLLKALAFAKWQLPTDIVIVVFTLLAAVAGRLCYLLLEKPMLDFMRKRSARDPDHPGPGVTGVAGVPD